VGDHRVRAAEQGTGERDVAGAALVRETLWQMTTVCAVPVEAGHYREVRRRLERGEVGEDDQVRRA
jgi:hypothetical protein